MASRQHLARSGEVVTYQAAEHIEAKDQLKKTLRSLVSEDMRATLRQSADGDAAVRAAIENRLREMLEHEDASFSPTERAEIITDVADAILS